jgi:glucose/arabinose dehydrogenase
MSFLMSLLIVSAFAAEKVYESEGQKFQVETLTQQSDVIWGFDFLSDGRMIFTERGGVIKILDPKTKAATPVKGAPSVWVHGQGGLLDIRVHPKNANKIYLTYSEPVGKNATTAFAEATLSGNELKDFKKLFSAHEPNNNDIHFGSRIEFDGNGHVFFSVGDRNERPHVQDLAYTTGKILRLNEDGSVPNDNPFVGQKNAKPEIWSLGHRSPQGLFRHPTTCELWMSEMGPRGGDELNLVKRGANYGWPVITYGREYYGPKIGEGTEKAGMEQPIVYWVPSISPSGTNFYSGDVFPKWKDNVFLGNLSSTHLRRVVLNGTKVQKQEELLGDLHWRIRNVRTGPEGYLYLSTDDGKISRLVPAK